MSGIERISAHEAVQRPVYKALHRPLTVCGVERRMFFLAMMMGAATFNLFYSFLAGVLVFAALYAFGWWASKHDPDMLRIILSAGRARRRFDPAKHEIHVIEVM
jgi:type IV secretory pathway VirB3-like protein